MYWASMPKHLELSPVKVRSCPSRSTSLMLVKRAVGLALRFTDVAQVDGVAVTEDTPIDVASKHEGVTRLEGHGLAALRGGEAVEVVPIGEFGLCGELIFLRCYIIGVASHEEIGDSISSFEHGVQQSLT